MLPFAILDLEGEADLAEFALDGPVELTVSPQQALAGGPRVQLRIAALGHHQMARPVQVPFERREVGIPASHQPACLGDESLDSRTSGVAAQAARYPRVASFLTEPCFISRVSVAPTVAILPFLGESRSFPTMSPAV